MPNMLKIRLFIAIAIDAANVEHVCWTNVTSTSLVLQKHVTDGGEGGREGMVPPISPEIV